MDPKDVADKLVAKRDLLIKEGAEFFKEKTIGKHVASLVAKTGCVTLPALMDALQTTASSAPGSDGQMADAALNYLKRLTEHHA